MADRRPRDPYEVLGIRQDASSAEISRAYRRLARELHPDSRPAGTGAADQFRAATAAYELLSDQARRAAHDHRAGRGQPAPHSPARPAPAAAPGTSRSEAASQVRPLGPARRSPMVSVPAQTAAVRPGPVHIEPLPGSAPPAGQDAETRLADLLRLIELQARGRWYRAW